MPVQGMEKNREAFILHKSSKEGSTNETTFSTLQTLTKSREQSMAVNS